MAQDEGTIGLFPQMMISLIISTLMVGFHTYIAFVIERMVQPVDTNITVTIYSILLAFPFIMILGMMMSHALESRIAYPFSLLAGVTMALFQYLFLWASIAGPILLLVHLIGFGHLIKEFSTMILLIFGVLVLLLLLIGYLDNLRLRTKREVVALPGYGDRNVKLAVISDLHLGPLVGSRRIRQIRSILEKEKPDIIAMAGDLFDTRPKNVMRLIPALKELWKIAPTYGVMGNHEFINGPAECDKAIRSMGITLLRGEMVKDQGTGLNVVGLDDPHRSQVGEGPRKVLKDILTSPTDHPTIMINHQPIEFEEASSLGIALQVSGHTHGGQLWPNYLITRKVFKDGDRGLISKYGSYMYISLGAGTWGPPMRIGNPPEVAMITMQGL